MIKTVPPSAFGDIRSAPNLQRKGIVNKVSLAERLCQVVSRCRPIGSPAETPE
jgi:hypothetical protein